MQTHLIVIMAVIILAKMAIVIINLTLGLILKIVMEVDCIGVLIMVQDGIYTLLTLMIFIFEVVILHK